MHTYMIRTFGCQMNKHDSERVAGLLGLAGLTRAETAGDADVIVFMTCCVRENADERLRGQVASLKALKPRGGQGPLIAVGGCIGQRDAEVLLEHLPHVDVVFGTNNIERLPALLESAAAARSPQVEVVDATDAFASDLPAEREHPWHAWVPVTVGCDNFCSYCVVPYVRGRERSRPIESILEEVERLVADGVREITLLGQNVNSYGRDRYGELRFAEVLARVAGTGIDRIRFATSHPKDLSDATIAAMAAEPAVMPYLHLPVQSGSDAVLERMNRRYTRAHYLSLVDRVRGAVPDLALSTDIIIGFPGETDHDFEDTLDLVERCHFDQAFTFIYSPRQGTPAAAMDAAVPRDVAQVRFDSLVERIQASALRNNRRLVGTVQPVLFEGPSKRDPLVLTGRTPSNKVTHVAVSDPGTIQALQGTIHEVRIDAAHTWFLTGTFVGTTS